MVSYIENIETGDVLNSIRRLYAGEKTPYPEPRCNLQ